MSQPPTGNGARRRRGARRRFRWSRRRRRIDESPPSAAADASTPIALASLLDDEAGVLVESSAATIIYVNDWLIELVGLRSTAAELAGQPVSIVEDRLASLVDPRETGSNAEGLRAQRQVSHGDVLRLGDGRTIERDYTPIVLMRGALGHLW